MKDFLKKDKSSLLFVIAITELIIGVVVFIDTRSLQIRNIFLAVFYTLLAITCAEIIRTSGIRK